MSIYEQCSQAARDLIADPALTEQSPHPGFFTDLDVVLLAAQRAGGYSDEEMSFALIEANNVLKVLYGKGQVARFGPVRIHPRIQKPDYARIASRIVHADPTDGPAAFETPNGTFKRLLVWKDKARGAGRRFGTNRDDRKPWDDQDDLQDAILRSRLARAS